MKIFRRRRGAAELWKTDVLAKLREPRCWVCTQLISEVNRDFFWFINEQYYEIGVIDKMRLSYGFCPTHTRHFLLTGAHSVNVTVFSYLTWYVITRLNTARDLLMQGSAKQDRRNLCVQAAMALRPPGTCPMCESLHDSERRNLHVLTYTLMCPDVRAAYESSPSLCLPHFREAANQADWDTVCFLTADMRRRLDAKVLPESPTTTLLEQVVGLDKDMSLKRSAPRDKSRQLAEKNRDPVIYIELGKPEPLWSPTFEQLLASLAEPGCPVCSACDQGVRQYLHWLAQQVEAQPRITDSWEANYHVCPAHLWALYGAGYEQAAMLIGSHTIQDCLARLNRLTAGLSFRPSANALKRLRQGFLVWCGANHVEIGPDSERPRSRRSKAAAVIESPQGRLNALRTVAFRSDACEACHYVRTTTRQRLDLILRALEDPFGRKAYHAASGLCLRHCIEAANLAEVPTALAEVLAAQIARFRILEWELQESSRKNNWSVRYEPKGPECDVWHRAAYQFCGIIV